MTWIRFHLSFLAFAGTILSFLPGCNSAETERVVQRISEVKYYVIDSVATFKYSGVKEDRDVRLIMHSDGTFDCTPALILCPKYDRSWTVEYDLQSFTNFEFGLQNGEHEVSPELALDFCDSIKQYKLYFKACDECD